MGNEFLIDTGLVNLAYLVASILFILGIKGLTHPRTAVRGNFLGAMGMLLAALATLLAKGLDFRVILAGIVVGGLIGAVAAARVQMTAMPQMVAIFNGFGGIASVLVAGGALAITLRGEQSPDLQMIIATAASGLIGAVTFTGSVVAFGKLQGLRLFPSSRSGWSRIRPTSWPTGRSAASRPCSAFCW